MYKSIVRPFLFRFNSDVVHDSTVKWGSRAAASGMVKNLASMVYDYQSPSLKQEILGLNFRNPVGLAAGFDKNGTLAPIIEALGFGFVEVGSITAIASTGNPKPRSFRLAEDQSLINRMGLNNDGAATIIKRLKKLRLSIPIGINIAKTHDPDITGDDALEDYFTSFTVAKDMADYITLNISCPNTREGKTFEDPDVLYRLLKRLQIGSDLTLPPVFVKFSVDLDRERLAELIDVTRSNSVSGYVAVNTSGIRTGLATSPGVLSRIGTGGLSGRAIRERSNRLINDIHELTYGAKPIIGVGGIYNAEDAIQKIKAGADLLQVYTGLVYEGPSIVRNINKGIKSYLRENGIEHIYQVRTSLS
ncbi:MAG: quinone-dependent dihydroorotate dehydrogenase [Balneolaceae bacterium]